MAFDARGTLHISSRFDGTVYRVLPDDTLEVVASELGVACGIAFGSDGTLFVGDRGGSIFRIGQTGRVVPFVTLPPSIVAYHLAIGPDDDLFVAAPTLDPCDRVYRISRLGEVKVVSTEFGRPQGLACDADGQLWVTEAVAGGAGLYLVHEGRPRELKIAAPALVGVAFDPRGGLVVTSGDTIYRLDPPVRPWVPRA
jgi:sugar lactone lactonase YvrE